jgi:hypothetical protein
VDGIAVADVPLSKNLWVPVDDVDPRPGPGWTYKDGVFSPPVVIAPTLPNIITKLAFRFRLTDAEYVGILAAAKTDVEVMAWVETFNMVSQINLEDSRTVSGLEMMVTKSLLTEERKTEILTAPVQDSERP